MTASVAAETGWALSRLIDLSWELGGDLIPLRLPPDAKELQNRVSELSLALSWHPVLHPCCGGLCVREIALLCARNSRRLLRGKDSWRRERVYRRAAAKSWAWCLRLARSFEENDDVP